MQIEKIEFDNVHYNPEREAFETLVKVHDKDRQYSYPAHIHAPLNAEFGFVARGLAQVARRAHRAKASGMRLAHATPIAVAPVSAQQKTLLDRLLGKMAA